MTRENLRRLRLVRNEMLCKYMEHSKRANNCLTEAHKPGVASQRKEELKNLFHLYFFIAGEWKDLFHYLDTIIHVIEEEIQDARY